MQACRAYYSNGRFVPIGLGTLPEGTQAIITLLNEPPKGVAERLDEFDRIMVAINAATDEEMPPIEGVRLRGCDL